jgi:hypothetical protein
VVDTTDQPVEHCGRCHEVPIASCVDGVVPVEGHAHNYRTCDQLVNYEYWCAARAFQENRGARKSIHLPEREVPLDSDTPGVLDRTKDT